MKLLLQREISRDQNSTGNTPAAHAIFSTKKDIWQKTVSRQKHVLNVTLKDL